MSCGLDTNILVYLLDPLCPENRVCAFILERLSPEFTIALNPTTVHEAYTVLVYARKWEREDARRRLTALLKDPYVKFYNQTRDSTMLGLHLAEKYAIRGRDALILSNLLMNKVGVIYTHDKEIKRLAKVTWQGRDLAIEDPVTK